MVDGSCPKISRDSTAIIGREKPVKKVKEPKKPRKRGRPAKSEEREPVTEKRLDRQARQSAEEAIRELPVVCDRGTKKDAKGYKTSWSGYKLPLDTNDIGLPISALVISASLHDSQAAIPLIKLTSGKGDLSVRFDGCGLRCQADRGDKPEV